jgi:hypothetical protein
MHGFSRVSHDDDEATNGSAMIRGDDLITETGNELSLRCSVINVWPRP